MIPGDDPLREAGRVRPDTVAVIDRKNEHRWTFRELDERVDRLADGLRAHGIKSGDRVALQAPVRGETVEAIHAIHRCGGIVVPMESDVGSDRIRSRLSHVQPREVLVIEPSGGWDDIADSITLSTIRAAGTATPTSFVSQDVDALAALLFTSGTTSEPRAVRVTHRMLTASALASGFRLGVNPADRWIDCLPPYHMGGFAPILRAVIYGTGVLMQPFETEAITNAIQADGATGISLVPVLLRRGIDHEIPYADLRVVLVGGAPTPSELVRRSLDLNIPIHITYGMTESASQITTATPGELRSRIETVGRPLTWTSVSIRGEAGEELNPAETGEIVVQGPTVSPGYWHGESSDPENRELITGDQGFVDASGFLYITGRKDDRIISGGVTIYPETVATHLESHQDIAEVMIVGLPDETWGEQVGAVVRLQDTSADVEHVIAAAAEGLSVAEQPKQVVQVKTLPRTESGTVDRRAARRLFTSDSE